MRKKDPLRSFISVGFEEIKSELAEPEPRPDLKEAHDYHLVADPDFYDDHDTPAAVLRTFDW